MLLLLWNFVHSKHEDSAYAPADDNRFYLLVRMMLGYMAATSRW